MDILNKESRLRKRKGNGGEKTIDTHYHILPCDRLYT